MNLYPVTDHKYHENLKDADKLASYSRAGVIAVAFDENGKIISVDLLNSEGEKIPH